jgi:ABC-type nitrate/sulfonate/bicarbonate transport system ATPase subunit
MIRVEGLSKTIGSTHILDRLTLALEPGTVTALLGPSGSGKTTLLRLLAGLETPDEGQVLGMPETGPAFVFQDHRVIPWLTVEENVAFALPLSWGQEARRTAIEESLELTRLDKLRGRYPDALSGGQSGRIDLARALASGRSVMLLDEPFKGLDLELKLELMADFVNIAERKKMTALLVTHDLDEALLVADRILVVEGPPLKLSEAITPVIKKSERFLFDPALVEVRRTLYDWLVKKS